MAKCPICNADVKAKAENKAFPFCSPRCRTVDLGNWLNGSYRVPVEEEISTEALLDDSPPTSRHTIN
ncbi:hypothetical protein AKJ09_05330 [Labilithrix luteola]|uniref:Uncharacterized protein n=1 Tax=Labilithrix luteola TaxID=1391654 RepID=A0A0K1PZ39_9BACT|nr:DNA gyrase inhibitor YacG [Labilithrix luteola]AKU98666.1 hypothetical protein AKJ09_05330 [Labilithrix luteola]